MDINKIVSKALEDKGWLKLSPNDIKIMANRIVELELDIQACKKQCNIPDVVGQSEQLKCDNCKCTPEFEEWLLDFKIENNLYIVDDEQKNSKEEMYLLYREL